MGISPTRRPLALPSMVLLCASVIAAAVVVVVFVPSSIRVVEGAAFVASSNAPATARRRRPPPRRSSFSQSRLATSPDVDDDDGEGVDDDAEGPLPASGSFFYEVPPFPRERSPPSDDDDEDVVALGMGASSSSSSPSSSNPGASGFLLGDDPDDDGMEMFKKIIRGTRVGPGPGPGTGFARTTPTTDHATRSVIHTIDNSSFVGIGRPLNDVRNPEYDENGYTLYADETTGEKRRVFEALVEYPSVFDMKIVGRDEVDESRFVTDMVGIVARSCGVDVAMVRHTERKNGKWTSVTVHAPVRDADMLYALYECVDKDPRVKFKF